MSTEANVLFFCLVPVQEDNTVHEARQQNHEDGCTLTLPAFSAQHRTQVHSAMCRLAIPMPMQVALGIFRGYRLSETEPLSAAAARTFLQQRGWYGPTLNICHAFPCVNFSGMR